jgi:hypothetical protein
MPKTKKTLVKIELELDLPKNMKSFTVHVKGKHIKQGKPGQGDYCPIALALKDMGYSDVNVQGAGAIEVDGVDLEVPDNIDKFIGKFDDHESVKPFSFVAKPVLDEYELKEQLEDQFYEATPRIMKDILKQRKKAA